MTEGERQGKGWWEADLGQREEDIETGGERQGEGEREADIRQREGDIETEGERQREGWWEADIDRAAGGRHRDLGRETGRRGEKDGERGR